jgi:hypothetical protein
METVIGFCGIDCGKCPAYIAKKENNDELRKKTAEEWSKMFGTQFTPEGVNCDGCAVQGQHIIYCEQLCDIRKCAVEKKVENCAVCADYGCEKLEAFLKNVPEARKTLEDIRQKPKGEDPLDQGIDLGGG